MYVEERAKPLLLCLSGAQITESHPKEILAGDQLRRQNWDPRLPVDGQVVAKLGIWQPGLLEETPPLPKPNGKVGTDAAGIGLPSLDRRVGASLSLDGHR